MVRGYLKPISTLRRPLESVDFATREPVKAAYERSDVCVVPAAGVAAEAMVALTLAKSGAGEIRRRLGHWNWSAITSAYCRANRGVLSRHYE